MIACVADASALMKLVIAEAHSEMARAYFATARPGAPALLRAEVANVLRRMVKSKKFSIAEAHAALETIVANAVLLPETDEDVHLTLDLAIALDHPAQDCRYLAAAIAAKVPYVTADENFARKAREAGHPAYSIAEAVKSPFG
jgi:predicted nucleic acid-binding protein